MANLWHCKRQDKQFGPFSDQQLKQLAASGKLQPSDMVQREGTDQWAPANRLKGLFPIAVAKPLATDAPSPETPPPLPPDDSDTPPPMPPNEQETAVDIDSWTASASAPSPTTVAKISTSPRLQKKKSKRWLWVAAVVGGLIVLGGIGAGLSDKQGSGGSKSSPGSRVSTSSQGSKASQGSDEPRGNGSNRQNDRSSDPNYQQGYKTGVKNAKMYVTTYRSAKKNYGGNPQTLKIWREITAPDLRNKILEQLSAYHDNVEKYISPHYSP